MLFPERICKLVTIYPSSEKITPEPISFLFDEYDCLLLEDIVTTEDIDFSDADTSLLLSLDIKYHVAKNVKNTISK